MTIKQMEEVAKFCGIRMELALAITYPTAADYFAKRNASGRFVYTFQPYGSDALYQFPDFDKLTMKQMYKQLDRIRRENRR